MERELVLAGGCFWGMQALLAALPGVRQTQAGYANGTLENPTYEAVCAGNTGHAEAVRVRYEDTALPLDALLGWYLRAIDPLAANGRAGQYRNGIYYSDAADAPAIRAELAARAAGPGGPPAVELAPLRCFYPAEEYHQHYLEKNPGGYCHIPQALLREARSRPVEIPDCYRAPAPGALRAALSPLAYRVLCENATEPPFSHPEWNRFAPGIYVDAATGEPLFASADKVFSPCGWPSFSRPIVPEVLRERADESHGMHRVEVRSRGGDFHMGHVFEDGAPEQGGRRYCINGCALRFIPRGEMERAGYGALLPLAF